MPIPTEDERLGTTLSGRYRLERILGRGGMGVVYEARHTYTGRRVAVKLLRPEVRPDGTHAKRLQQEARAAAALEHPSIVDVLDMGEADGCLFLVLELLQGPSLSELLKERGPLPEPEVVALGLRLADALGAAHGVGVVHRDVTPRNVVMARRGDDTVPTLIDFGLAKVDDGEVMTTTGAVMGTAWYMSPEQAAGTGAVGPESDVWALAAVLHECLTGERAFDGPSATAVLMNVLRGRSPSLDALPRDGLGSVLRDALSQGPRRIRAASALAERLHSITTGITSGAAPARGPHRVWPRVALGLAVLLSSIAAVAVAYRWEPEPSAAPLRGTDAGPAEAVDTPDAGVPTRNDPDESMAPPVGASDAGLAAPPDPRSRRRRGRPVPPETDTPEDSAPGLRTRW